MLIWGFSCWRSVVVVVVCLFWLGFFGFFFVGWGWGFFCAPETRSIVLKTPGKGSGSCSSGKREALKRSPDVVSREKAV